MAHEPKREPRVYWLTEEFFPPEIGGTGLMAACLSQGIAGLGLPTVVITRQTDPPHAVRDRIGPLTVRRIAPAGRMKGAGWKAFPVMLLYLARLFLLLLGEGRRYDIVVTSGMKIIPLAAVPVCRLLGKKCIVRLESPFELAEPISAEALGAMQAGAGGLLPGILRRLQRAALRRADRVIAISRDIEARLLECDLPHERIVRIPNAIDLGRFHPVSEAEQHALRRSLSLPAGRDLVLYAGRLSRAKGIAMLIEAWPQILAQHPDLVLVMVGSGQGSWDDCEAQVTRFVREHGLADRVIFTGQSEQVWQYMQVADVFVSPSEYEGFGLTVVEAMASGLPTVVTSVGVAPELIEQGVNGFLFEPKNPRAAIEAVEACLAARDRWRAIGMAARESTQPFDLKRVFAAYVQLCRDLAPP